MVYFGEMMPAGAVEEAFDLAERADAVISVGSTLTVFPAAYVPLRVAERGRPFVVLNLGPTDFDHLASIRLQAPGGHGPPRPRRCPHLSATTPPPRVADSHA